MKPRKRRQSQQGRQEAAPTSHQQTPLDEALRAIRPALAMMAGFSLCTNLLRLTIPLYMLQLVDRVLSSGNIDTLLYLTLIALFALVTAGAISAVLKTLQSRVGSWIESDLIEPTLRASLDGKLTNRSMGGQSTRDLAQIRNFFSNQALSTLFDLPWSPIFLIVIFLLHPILGAVGTGFAVILLALAVVHDYLTRGSQERAQQESGRLNEAVVRASKNADVLHAMGMVPAFLSMATAQSASARTSQDRASERGSWVSSVSRTLRQLAQIAMYATGAYLVLDGEATTGLMMAGSILLNLALSPIDQSVSTYRSVLNFRAALGRLRRQLSVTDEKSTRGRAAHKAPRGHLSVDRAMYLPQGQGQGQGRARPLIKQMSFNVPPGGMVGIIGPASAGKSVLCRLLLGLMPPQGGAVQLDGIDMHEWLAAGLGRHLGYLPQEPVFFPGSIADNIARLEAASLDRQVAVHEAAELVQAHGTIMNLPQGYETDMDDVASYLSRSELQKIALARAFYGKPRLIVLDEPANALDRLGEAALVEALSTLKKDRHTLVVVSQRPAIMRLCDRLLLLRDGAMDAYGEPSTVLEQLKADDEGGGGGGKGGRRLRVAHG